MPQPPNMNKMLAQVQKMQKDMEEAQAKLADETVEASAGGGMVSVTVTGALEIRGMTISPEAIDPDDPEMLQDLVLAATNEAIRAAQELQTTRMNAVAGPLAGGLGGLGIPGL